MAGREGGGKTGTKNCGGEFGSGFLLGNNMQRVWPPPPPLASSPGLGGSWRCFVAFTVFHERGPSARCMPQNGRLVAFAVFHQGSAAKRGVYILPGLGPKRAPHTFRRALALKWRLVAFTVFQGRSPKRTPHAAVYIYIYIYRDSRVSVSWRFTVFHAGVDQVRVACRRALYSER